MYGNTEICQSVSEKSRVSALVSLIVPGLMFATSMPLMYAIGTSLVAVTAFGAATAASYAASGLIDWRIAALFILGGVVGGAIGVALCRVLAWRKRVFAFLFASVVLSVGVYVVARSIIALA